MRNEETLKKKKNSQPYIQKEMIDNLRGLIMRKRGLENFNFNGRIESIRNRR